MPCPALCRIRPVTNRGLRNGIALPYLPGEEHCVLPRVGVVPLADPLEREPLGAVEPLRFLVPRTDLEMDPHRSGPRPPADALPEQRPADPGTPSRRGHGDVQQVGLARHGPGDGVPENSPVLPSATTGSEKPLPSSSANIPRDQGD